MYKQSESEKYSKISLANFVPFSTFIGKRQVVEDRRLIKISNEFDQVEGKR